MEALLDPHLHKSIVELGPYLKDSFGNAIRIDYGTGHEMAFILLLACLFKIGSLKVNLDEEAVGLVVFDR
jgi:serine/threonine-protein phosphatase 2A activator